MVLKNGYETMYWQEVPTIAYYKYYESIHQQMNEIQAFVAKWPSQNLILNSTSDIVHPLPLNHPYLLIHSKLEHSETREMIDTVSFINWATNQAKQTKIFQSDPENCLLNPSNEE
jgi:hypothetical protein